MNFLLFAQDPQPGGIMNSPTFPLLLIGLMVLFFLVVVRPMSRRQQEEQQKMLASLKRGAKILTNAGIVATVVTANDGEDEIVIRSEDTKLRIKRNVVVQVLDAAAAEPAAK